MDLHVTIDPELWEVIRSSYEAGNYRHGVVDAMQVITTVLREKGGVDGDGTQLVGDVLGGKNPRVKLNKFQTETDISVQEGVTQLLRGMYLAIRNPRVHEKPIDAQKTADSIIVFINYILEILRQGEERFSIERFMQQVFDPDFVPSDEYAVLLVQEIPSNKLFDATIALYNKGKERSQRYQLKYVGRALWDQMDETQREELMRLMARDFRVGNARQIIAALYFIAPEKWESLDAVARLRAKNVIRSFIMARRSMSEYYEDYYDPEENEDDAVLGKFPLFS